MVQTLLKTTYDIIKWMKRIGKTKITPIPKQGDWGLYVWKLPNGKILGDAEGNILNIPGKIHDFQAMSKLQAAAREVGYEEGTAIFKAHISRVSEEEHQEQLERMLEGKIPSYTDQGAWNDVANTARRWQE